MRTRALFTLFIALSTGAWAQSPQPANPCQVEDKTIDPAPPQGVSVEQIIQRFAAKEAEFKEARDQYTYRQDVTVQTLNGNTPTGEYREVVDITFKDNGKRLENVVFAPQSTLREVSLESEDLDDIRNRYPFVLTTEELPLYQVLYVGRQRVDVLDTYVFDVAPKTVEKGKRYFQGRIWVDQQDLQIVKTCGRPAYVAKKQKRGQESLYPSFTSYREQIDGKYWFPTYARADEILPFSFADVHIRIKVKYTDYKRFQSKSKIIFTGEEAPPEDPKQPPQQPPQSPPKK